MKNKKLFAVLIVWSFIHLVILVLGSQYTKEQKNDFWVGPEVYKEEGNIYWGYEGGYKHIIDGREFKRYSLLNPLNWRGNYWYGWDSNLRVYDLSEFLVYAIGPWLIFLLYRFLNSKDSEVIK